MSIYSYYIGNPGNISTLVTNLNNKILVDLDLPLSNYTSTVYNNTSQCIDVTFTIILSDSQLNVLNNLVSIIVYSKNTRTDIYVVTPNQFNRRSLGVTNSPAISNDVNSGYSIGSMVTTNTDVYVCTNNAANNAVWMNITATGPTGPTGLQGNVGPTGINGSTAISYLGEISATGTYSWFLSQNVTYTLGTTFPTNNLISILSPSPNSYWSNNADSLQYIGTPTISVMIMCIMNFNSGSNNKTYTFTMLKNGITIPNTTVLYVSSNTNPNIVTFSIVVTVATNDVIRITMITTSTGGDVITLRYYRLTAYN